MKHAQAAQLLLVAAQALAAGAPILAKYGAGKGRYGDDEAWAAYSQQIAALQRIAIGLEVTAKAEIKAGAAVN